MKRCLLFVFVLILSLFALAYAEEEVAPTIVERVNYCEVREPGETIVAVRLEYSEPIAMNAMFGGTPFGGWDLNIPFETNYDLPIVACYTNTTGAFGEYEGAGQYIFLEFDMSWVNGSLYKNYITFNESTKTRTFWPITVVQTRPLTTVNGNVVPAGYGATTREIRAIIDDFEVVKWTCAENGVEYDILVYLPEGYDGDQTFPLVVHFTNGGDASYTDYSGGRIGGLFTHADAVTWADPESQAEWPCIVIAYGKDQADAIDATAQLGMIHYVLDNYAVDTNRIYAVSLAGATPRLFECALAEPELFAALVYCSYDPIHVYKDLALASEKYTEIVGLFPTWAVVSEADTTGAQPEGVVPPEMQAAGKGARCGNFALYLNENYGTNITVAGNNGDMPMWNGFLRGDAATALANELVALGEAKGSDDYVSVFIAGTTPYVDHWSWANGYINMGLHAWLFTQSK